MAKKVLKQVRLITDFKTPTVDHTFQKSISYSQTLVYNTCPHQWAVKYVKGIREYKPSIHTVFGTALHEVLQEWLTELYQGTVKASNEMDLDNLLLTKMQTIYKAEKDKTGDHFTTPELLQEFYTDGVQIIKYVKSKRTTWFGTKHYKLVGVEIPLIYPLSENILFKGFIDIVMYDEQEDKYIILDIKTSTSGWSSYAKKDDKKLAQLLLYKEFFAKQFGVDVEKVDVKYFIVKRKVPADPEYPAMGRRVQEFIPPSGKIKRGQALTALNKFIADSFSTTGTYNEKDYEKTPSKSNCMFCEFKGTEHCDVGVLE